MSVTDFSGKSIVSATKLLLQVKAQDVRLHPLFASKKLYAGTSLDGRNCPVPGRFVGLRRINCGEDRRDSGDDKREFKILNTSSGLELEEKINSEGADEIARKNIYFLARHTKKPVELAIHLTQIGMLTLNQKDFIIDRDNDLLSAVELYSVLVKKHPKDLKAFLDILRATQNDLVADWLDDPWDESGLAGQTEKTKGKKVPPARPPPPSRMSIRRVRESPWECRHCTFMNASGEKSCSMCHWRKGTAPATSEASGEDEMEEKSTECPHCTYVNPPGRFSCEVCQNGLWSLVEFD